MHAANASNAVSPHAATAACPLAPEKVGMCRIRLMLSRQCVSANVGSFFAADKVLQSWALRSGGTLECAFEIVYDDGHTLAGEYRFACHATRRPALMLFVRKTLQSLCEGAQNTTPVRGLVDGPRSFLAHYDTDDFSSL